MQKLKASQSTTKSKKVAELYEDEEDDEDEVIRDAQLAKAAGLLAPLARLSLNEPSVPRLGHLLGRRILEEENDAGECNACRSRELVPASM